MSVTGDAKTLMLDLSGEHGTLPTTEVLAVLEAEGIGHRVVGTDERVLLISVDVAHAKAIALRLAARLSMCHSISLHIASSGPSIDDIISAATKAAETLPSYPATSTFRVRCERMRGRGEGLDTPGLEKGVARVLWKGRKVDLKAPETDYKVIVSTRWHLGEIGRAHV